MLFKGESVLAEMRKYFKNKCVTASEIRELVTRSGSYLRDVLERSAAAGIIEKGKKCVQEATCYEIDPKDDRPICPLEPEKPYEESVCFTLEKSIEDSVLAQERDLNKGYSDWHQCKTSLEGELEKDDKSFITEAMVFHHSAKASHLKPYPRVSSHLDNVYSITKPPVVV